MWISTTDTSQGLNQATTIVEELPRKRNKKSIQKKAPKWQERLLPIMVGLLVGLTVFFFVSTFLQMTYLHRSILQLPPIDINPASDATLIADASTFEEQLTARQLEIRTRMEIFIVTQRYHQISVLLMAGLWVRYLGFITGMILALVGASFVLGKLREPTQKLDGKFSGIDISLRTASPGIILVVLGVILMFSTIVDRDIYQVSDRATYLSSVDAVLTPGGNLIDTLPAPDQIFATPVPESK